MKHMTTFATINFTYVRGMIVRRLFPDYSIRFSLNKEMVGQM